MSFETSKDVIGKTHPPYPSPYSFIGERVYLYFTEEHSILKRSTKTPLSSRRIRETGSSNDNE